MSFNRFYKRKNPQVEKLANKLKEFLEQKEIKDQIESVHMLNGKSQTIQRIIEPFLTENGFASEKKGLFRDYNLRPDFYNSNLKIIVEVERGKTKSNNMHLLDIWKCHLNPEADHLFLIIPIERHRKDKTPEKIFDHVVKVIPSFFEKENYVNIESCYIFGY